MKTKNTLRHFLLLAGSSLLAISSAAAADGTWNQTAAGTYSWDTAGNWVSDTIATGTDNTATFGNLSGAQTVTIDSARTIGNIDYNGTNNFLLTIGGDETLTMAVTPDDPPIIPAINTQTRRMIIASGLQGNQGLLKTGAERLQFDTTPPTFTGGLTLAGGNTVLNVAMTSIGGAGSTITVTANSQLEMSGGHATNLDNNIHINDNVTFTHRRGQPNTTTITGVVSGGDTTTLRVTDAGGIFQRTLFLNNTANTFTGAIDLTQNRSGIIVGSLPDSEGAGNINFGGNDGGFALGSTAISPMGITNRHFTMTAGNGTVRIENRNADANNTLTINSNLSMTGDTGTKTLQLGGGNTGINTLAVDIGNAYPTFNLTKADGGTWHLAGTNTYNGTTTVSAGTLLINGDQSAATGAVAVNGTSTLGGSGTIGGTVTVAVGAKIAPGTSVGTLAILGGLDISAMAGGAGTLNYELGPIAASDKITVAGTLTIGSGALGLGDFVLANLGSMQAGTYKLITSGAAIDGTLDEADLTAMLGDFELELKINGNDLELMVGGGASGDYVVWAESFLPTVIGLPHEDDDGDGLSNDQERIFGLDPTSGTSVNPISVPLDPAAGTFSFTRRDPSLTGLIYKVWYSTDLVNWEEDAAATLTPGAVVGQVQTVAVALGEDLLNGPRLFLRVGAEAPPPPAPLLTANFEDDNGGFTVATLGGTAWEWGAPNSPSQGGGAVTAGNGGSAKCWGTNLTGGYTTGTDTSLRSPVINLPAETDATLSFAAAIDAEIGHTLEVNVIDDTTDTVIANLIPAASDADIGASPWQAVGPVALPAAARGQAVRIEWRFVGSGDGSFNGAYLDDVTVTP